MVECGHYKYNSKNAMGFILYGVILIGIISLIFFGYKFVRRAGWRCVSDGKKTCVGDSISEFYKEEDKQKDSVDR